MIPLIQIYTASFLTATHVCSGTLVSAREACRFFLHSIRIETRSLLIQTRSPDECLFTLVLETTMPSLI